MSPAPASAIDTPAPMLHPPGNMTFKNKYSTTVLHQNLGIILANHDLGIMLPHIQIAPAVNNFFTPMHILFSSRKIVFSSSSVKVDKAFVGFGGVIGLPPTPMMVCAEPMGFPTGEVPTRWFNTVWVGMTWMDWLLGVGTIAVSMYVDRLFNAKGKYGPLKKLVKDQRQGLGKLVAKKMFPQSMTDAKKLLSKQAAGLATGIVTAMAKGEGETGLSIGSDYANVGLKVKRDDSGKWNATVKAQVPAEAVTVGVEQEKGVYAKAEANWGGGAVNREISPKEEKVVSHNAFTGESSSKSFK
jgi:hypothetical protein